jgi:hypothetical protein
MNMSVVEKPDGDTTPPAPPTSPAPAPATNVEKKRVILALPGDNFSSAFLMSLLATMNTLLDSNKYQLIISPGISSYVTFARMQTLGLNVLRGSEQKVFDGEAFDYWITIDSDQVFSPVQIIDLLDSLETHPVVAGCYRMSNLTHYPVVEEWDTEFFKKNGSFEFMGVEKLEAWKKENEGENFLKVSYAGMGFFGMRKEVLDSMKYPYFDSEKTTIEGDKDVVLHDIMSEDVAFCKNIQKAGYDIMLKATLRVGHEKRIVL